MRCGVEEKKRNKGRGRRGVHKLAAEGPDEGGTTELNSKEGEPGPDMTPRSAEGGSDGCHTTPFIGRSL